MPGPVVATVDTAVVEPGPDVATVSTGPVVALGDVVTAVVAPVFVPVDETAVVALFPLEVLAIVPPAPPVAFWKRSLKSFAHAEAQATRTKVPKVEEKRCIVPRGSNVPESWLRGVLHKFTPGGNDPCFARVARTIAAMRASMLTFGTRPNRFPLQMASHLQCRLQ